MEYRVIINKYGYYEIQSRKRFIWKRRNSRNNKEDAIELCRDIKRWDREEDEIDDWNKKNSGKVVFTDNNGI